MKDVTTINQALNDMKDYYGLEDISHVKLNMDNLFNSYIEFISNNIDIDDKYKEPQGKVIYRLTLTMEGILEA